MVAKEQTARQLVREWVRAEIEGKDGVHLPTLRDRAIDHFGGNYALMGAIAREAIKSVVYQVASQEVGKGRAKRTDDAELIDGVEERAEEFASRFLNWFEHNGTQHVRLMEATREELMEMAAIRRSRGNHELGLAALFEGIADRLEGDQRVSERFTADEIEAMYRRVETAEGVTN